MPRDTIRGDTRTADSIKKTIAPPSELSAPSAELSVRKQKRLKQIITIFRGAYQIKKKIGKSQKYKILRKLKAGVGKSVRTDHVHQAQIDGVQDDRFVTELAQAALQGYKGPRKLTEIINEKLAGSQLRSGVQILAHDVKSTAASVERAVANASPILALKRDAVSIETKILSDEAVVKTLAQSIERVLPLKESIAWTAHALGTVIAEPAFHMVGEVLPVFKVFKSMKDVYDLGLDASKLRKKIKEIKPSLDQALEEHESLTQKLSKELQVELSKIYKAEDPITEIMQPLPRINAEDRYTVERYISMRFKLKFKKRGDALRFLKKGQGKNLAAMSANEIAYVLGLLDPDKDKSNIQSLTLVLKNEIEKFEKVIRDKQDIGDTTKEKLIDMYKVMIEQSVTRARLARSIRLFQSKEEVKRAQALLGVALICCTVATGVVAIVATFGLAILPLLLAGHAVVAASSVISVGLGVVSKAVGKYDSLLLKDKHEAALRHDPLESITSILESGFVKKIKENDKEITASIVNLNIIIADFINIKSDVEKQLQGFEGSVGNAQFTPGNLKMLDNLIDRLIKYRDNLTLESRELYVGLLNDDLSINFDKYEANLKKLDLFNRVMKGSITELLAQSPPLAQQISNIVNLEYQAHASYEGDQSMISHEKKIKEFRDKLPSQQAILDEMGKNILGTLERAEKGEQTDILKTKSVESTTEFNEPAEAEPSEEIETPQHGRRNKP